MLKPAHYSPNDIKGERRHDGLAVLLQSAEKYSRDGRFRPLLEDIIPFDHLPVSYFSTLPFTLLLVPQRDLPSWKRSAMILRCKAYATLTGEAVLCTVPCGGILALCLVTPPHTLLTLGVRLSAWAHGDSVNRQTSCFRDQLERFLSLESSSVL